MNLSILIGTLTARKDRERIFTTDYRRWNEPFREYLFNTMSYIASTFYEPFAAITKINSEIERAILVKLMKYRSLARLRMKEAQNPIYYHSGGRYFRKCVRKKLSNEYKELALRSGAAKPVLCLLSSSLYYWLWIVFSDCYHVTRADVDMLPVPDSILSDKRLHRLSDTLVDDLERNAEVRTRRRADGSEQKEVNYFVGRSKHLMDRIDHLLAEHYSLSAEEVHYLVNYDAKYRIIDVGDSYG